MVATRHDDNGSSTESETYEELLADEDAVLIKKENGWDDQVSNTVETAERGDEDVEKQEELESKMSEPPLPRHLRGTETNKRSKKPSCASCGGRFRIFQLPVEPTLDPNIECACCKRWLNPMCSFSSYELAREQDTRCCECSEARPEGVPPSVGSHLESVIPASILSYVFGLGDGANTKRPLGDGENARKTHDAARSKASSETLDGSLEDGIETGQEGIVR